MVLLIKIIVVFIDWYTLKPPCQSEFSDKPTSSTSPKKVSLLKLIKDFLNDMVNPKNVLLIFFSADIILVVFTFSNQIQSFYALNPFDSFNLIYTVFRGFILIGFIIIIALYEDIFGKRKNDQTRKSMYLGSLKLKRTQKINQKHFKQRKTKKS